MPNRKVQLAGSRFRRSSASTPTLCDPQGVHAVWKTPVVRGLTAPARNDLIAVRYGLPQEGFAGNAAAWTYEVYVVRHLPPEDPTVTLVSRRGVDVATVPR